MKFGYQCHWYLNLFHFEMSCDSWTQTQPETMVQHHCNDDSFFPLQWRHNERFGVSNHRRHDCFLSRLFRRRSKKTSKLRVTGLCEGISPHIRPVTWKMFPFDDVIMRANYHSNYVKAVVWVTWQFCSCHSVQLIWRLIQLEIVFQKMKSTIKSVKIKIMGFTLSKMPIDAIGHIIWWPWTTILLPSDLDQISLFEYRIPVNIMAGYQIFKKGHWVDISSNKSQGPDSI